MITVAGVGFHSLLRHTVLPGGLTGPVGTTEVADPAAHTKHEVDVLALALGERPQAPRVRGALIGEAKATAARRGTGDLQRLERIRDLLADQGYDTDGTTLALFSLHGFYPGLIECAARREDLVLVDLAALYGVGDHRLAAASESRTARMRKSPLGGVHGSVLRLVAISRQILHGVRCLDR